MSVAVVGLALATALAVRRALAAGRADGVRRRLSRARAGGPARTGWSVPLPAAPAWFAGRLDDAGFDVAPATAWWAGAGALVLTVLGAVVVAGPALALLVGAAGPVAAAAVLRLRRGQGEAQLEQGLPAALEAVARSLRSGASLRQAVTEAAAAVPGRLGRELSEVSRRITHGAPVVTALEALAARRPSPGVRLAVAALCLSVETGGAQARAVDGVAATLRDRLAVAGEVRALSSQARISALVIGVAPLAFGAFAVTTDPRTGQFLLHTPAGLGLLAVGVSLDGLGWLWMQHLTRVAV